MKNFLVDELGMSEGHIQLLLSSDTPHPDIGPKKDPIAPTRINIIDTLFNLSKMDDIHYGDNIIIYFAGHGSIYECSDYYPAGDPSAEGSIKALCPMDRTPSGTDNSVPDISNREINAILTEISRTKGHHITVIVDCCYASGTTRNLSNAVPTIRRANPMPSTSIQHMLATAHERLKDLPKYHSVFDGNWNPDVTSHVLLAACTDYQPAEEEKGADNRWNGNFTRALIDALKLDSLEEESTYVDLFYALEERMPRINIQTPVVAGNVGERLWYRPEVRQYHPGFSGADSYSDIHSDEQEKYIMECDACMVA